MAFNSLRVQVMAFLANRNGRPTLVVFGAIGPESGKIGLTKGVASGVTGVEEQALRRFVRLASSSPTSVAPLASGASEA